DVTTEVARQFAAALDRDDYETARTFLTEETTYTIHGKLYIGVEQIIDRYRRSSEWATSTFDQVAYESSVEPLEENRVRVTFVDHITHGDETLDHTARQVLTVDPEREVIDGIKHDDHADEDESIEDFFEKTGVSRPPP
ncbi:MAG: hypothetical protein ABEN55_16775, partial [Bradymonadaceae bacterium]